MGLPGLQLYRGPQKHSLHVRVVCNYYGRPIPNAAGLFSTVM
jgi:hypothetical protein